LKSPTQKDLELLPHKFQVDFAIFCARQVEHLWDKYPACVRAIELAELFLEGKATSEECRVAAYATAYAAAAADAAYAAAHAAYAAAHAAYAAAAAAYAAAHAAAAAAAAYAAAYAATHASSKELIPAQWEYYNNLLHFDSIAEEILLVEEA
jgi:hypothetical protein